MLELLVVLTIVLLLAALLMPVFNRAKGRSHVAVCTSNLRQIYAALQLYRNDHGEYPKNSFSGIYWGGRDTRGDEASYSGARHLACPAWRALGCKFPHEVGEPQVPPHSMCEWYPYNPNWDGLWLMAEQGETKEPWERCRDSRGDALPIAYDENHALNVQDRYVRLKGAPFLILREGGQVTVHQTPLPRKEPFEDPACPYGSPFNW